MYNVLVMGMGAIGHTIVTSLDDKKVNIDVVTSTLTKIDYIENNLGDRSSVNQVRTYQDLLQSCEYDIIFLALPFIHKINRMQELKSAIKSDTTIVLLPANQGAIHYLPQEIQENNPIILLERVMQISRVNEKYKSVNVFGTRNDLKVAGVNGADPLLLSEIIPYLTELEVVKAAEISLISSNAVIHTCRIYNLFANNDDNYNIDIPFYAGWTSADAKLMIEMENEVIALKTKIEQVRNETINFYDMFTHFKIDPVTVDNVIDKISTNPALSPIIFKVENKQELLANRYLIDDALLGINYYLHLAGEYQVKMPKMEMVHNWALSIVTTEVKQLNDLYV